MGVSHKWLKFVRNKFLRSSNRDVILRRTSSSTNCSNQSEEVIQRYEATTFEEKNMSTRPCSEEVVTKEDIAAIRIQAYFRGHLARRAYRALRSLVKVQAWARGVSVREQSRVALDCMNALVRLQVRVRARQLLGNHG